MSKYQVFSLRNFRSIPQLDANLSTADKNAIEVVGNVLPFKVNNYVVNELIDWNNIPDDPIFQLTFPQREMLSDEHFGLMEKSLKENLDKDQLKQVANSIRFQLNPHPSGQQENVPMLGNVKLTGVQHKYRETVLFFPSNSQTCHAYCTFCFRWPQFVGIDELKFAMRETELLVKYLQKKPEVSDILFTGGDPMVMSAKNFAAYTEPLLNANLPNLQTIRIGTKSLSYWPYRFTSDKDADEMLRQFEKIVNNGLHLTVMAHFNHPIELQSNTVREAIRRIRNTGAQIRTQSPVMKRINDHSKIWSEMWREQVKLGLIPYYMFVARDTGAQDYFAIELEKSWRIFRNAYQKVSGIARTVRGPSMSADPGKVQILGLNEINDETVMTLRFIQARNPDWVGRPFFAKYDPNAVWLDDLEPAFDENEFFFEKEMHIRQLNFN
ncbi:MAG: lysine 2,3-aminomutase [Calditrichaeota bacterium]|nr:lysine 2,3-aminomutase [Calditrichota bacterium]